MMSVAGGDIGAGAGVADAVGGGMESELGAALSGAADTAFAEEAPGGEAGDEPSQPVEGAEETPGGEAPSSLDALNPTEEQPTSTAAQPDSGEAGALPSGWTLSEDGKVLSMPRTELPRVQGALQFAEQIGQYFQTPQDAQLAYQSASDLRQMANDWMYGTDDAIRSVLNHWAGANHQDPMGRQAFQRSFGKMAQMLPDVLKQTDPAGYQNLVTGMGNRLVQQLYEKASRTGDKADLMDAQAVEWGLTGKYQEKPPQHDPQAQSKADFEARERAFNQRQEAALQTDINRFNQTSVEGAKLAQLDQMISKQLDGIKSRYSEEAFKFIVEGVHRKVMDALKQRPEFWTEHRQNFDQLVNDYRTTWQRDPSGSALQPRVQAYIQDFLRQAGRLIPSLAQPVVNAATQARVAATKGTRGQTRPPASRPSATPSTSAPPANGKQETRSARFDREFAAMFRG